MKDQLTFQEAELQEKKDNADKLMDAIGQETEKLSKEEDLANDEEIKAKVITKVIISINL